MSKVVSMFGGYPIHVYVLWGNMCMFIYFLHYIRICLHRIYKICASHAKCAQGIYIYIYVHTTVWIRKLPSPLHLKVFQITSTSWHRLSYKDITSWIINLGSWRGSRYMEIQLNIQKSSWWWNSGILGRDHPIGASFNTSPGCKKHRRDKRKPPVLGKSLILGDLSNFLAHFFIKFCHLPGLLNLLTRVRKKIRLKQLTSFMPIPFPAKKRPRNFDEALTMHIPKKTYQFSLPKKPACFKIKHSPGDSTQFPLKSLSPECPQHLTPNFCKLWWCNRTHHWSAKNTPLP